jgi:hypothetical protein
MGLWFPLLIATGLSRHGHARHYAIENFAWDPQDSILPFIADSFSGTVDAHARLAFEQPRGVVTITAKLRCGFFDRHRIFSIVWRI